MPVDLAPEGVPREDFVKRLVGLPGDRLDWREGQLFVNGELLKVDVTPELFVDEAGHQFGVRRENLGECRHAILDDAGSHDPRLDHGTWLVEPGRYFLMGDNRDNSRDSREWGTVRLEELKGPAVILYWSWNVNGPCVPAVARTATTPAVAGKPFNLITDFGSGMPNGDYALGFRDHVLGVNP